MGTWFSLFFFPLLVGGTNADFRENDKGDGERGGERLMRCSSRGFVVNGADSVE